MAQGFKKAVVRGIFLLTVRKKIDAAIAKLGKKLFYSHNKIDENKVFIMTYDKQYTCNPRYITEEILRRNLPVDVVFATGKAWRDTFPEGVRTVIRGSFEMFEEQATAKIWIDNALNCVWYNIPKKKEQVYFNTWHGSMGIKRLGGNANWFKKAAKCNKQTDYCITNSKFEEDVFRQTFWKDTEFLKYGHARNDILFDTDMMPEIREKVMHFFDIPPHKKMVLYAPTFRDDGDLECYDLDYDKLHQYMEEKFGGDWVVLVRAHFKNRGKAKQEVEEEEVFYEWMRDASIYPDMQELMTVVDAGITDYSSWAYDYVLTRRPMFIYAPDIEKYNTDRGFYFPLESTPFLIATTNEEMKEAIDSFDNEVYQKKVAEFLEDKGCYEEGNAAYRTVNKICEIVGLEPDKVYEPKVREKFLFSRSNEDDPENDEGEE